MRTGVCIWGLHRMFVLMIEKTYHAECNACMSTQNTVRVNHCELTYWKTPTGKVLWRWWLWSIQACTLLHSLFFFLQLLHRFRGSSRSPFDATLIISAAKWQLRLLTILHHSRNRSLQLETERRCAKLSPSHPPPILFPLSFLFFSFCCRSPIESPQARLEEGL